LIEIALKGQNKWNILAPERIKIHFLQRNEVSGSILFSRYLNFPWLK